MPRAGVLQDGLLHVEEAGKGSATARKLQVSTPVFVYWWKISECFAENIVYIQHLPPETLIFLFAETSGMNVRHVFAAFRSSNAAKSPFCDK